MANNKVFENVQVRRPDRNVFDLSHEYKTTFNMGQLIPCLCEEIIPGDKFIVDSEILIRLMPMTAPVMHRIDVFMHYFFVPNRIIWEDWEEFITGGEDGLSTKTIPTLQINSVSKTYFRKGFLSDYLGIPAYNTAITHAQSYVISALPFKAYQEIYNEYYRDQNLIPRVDITDNVEMFTLRNRAYEKDYFTSALPWLQRGSEISLPLGSTADLSVKSSALAPRMRKISDDTALVSKDLQSDILGKLTDGSVEAYLDVSESHEVDLSTATAATVNELRRGHIVDLQGLVRAVGHACQAGDATVPIRSPCLGLQRPCGADLLADQAHAAGLRTPGGKLREHIETEGFDGIELSIAIVRLFQLSQHAPVLTREAPVGDPGVFPCHLEIGFIRPPLHRLPAAEIEGVGAQELRRRNDAEALALKDLPCGIMCRVDAEPPIGEEHRALHPMTVQAAHPIPHHPRCPPGMDGCPKHHRLKGFQVDPRLPGRLRGDIGQGDFRSQFPERGPDYLR